MQRDQARGQVEKLRFNLGKQEKRHRVLAADHRRTWLERHSNRFNLTVPPRDLVEHIAYQRNEQLGEPSIDLLLEGYLTMLELRSLIESTGTINLAGIRSALDFGCGCGRVTRFLKDLNPGGVEQVQGCDVDGEAIGWNLRNLGDVGDFFVIPSEPPLVADMRAYDLILALSVFTHLPEKMEKAWLRQLRAMLAPGGVLVATYHGASFHRLVPPEHRARFAETGFAHLDLGRTPGLPDFYLTSFHSGDYVRNMWVEEFRSVTLPETTLEGQEVALLVA